MMHRRCTHASVNCPVAPFLWISSARGRQFCAQPTILQVAISTSHVCTYYRATSSRFCSADMQY